MPLLFPCNSYFSLDVQTANVQTVLCISNISPETSLLAHTNQGCRIKLLIKLTAPSMHDDKYQTLMRRPLGSRIINFLYITQLSMQLQLIIQPKMLKNGFFFCYKPLRCCINSSYSNVKVPTIVGILTSMSRID